MDQTTYITCLYDYSDAGLERIFQMLDLLHDFASERRLVEATPLRASEMIGWLEDIIFTAEETIREIDAHTPEFHVRDEPRVLGAEART